MEASSNDARTAETRRMLLEQLGHLVDEVEALKAHLEIIPEPVVTDRPLPEEPSFQEIYLLLARYDEEVYTPAVERLVADERVHVRIPEYEELLSDKSVGEHQLAGIIDHAAAARMRLLALLEDLPIDRWSLTLDIDGSTTDVFGLAFGITQHDAALLRMAGYRLHESRLTSRDEDLPK